MINLITDQWDQCSLYFLKLFAPEVNEIRKQHRDKMFPERNMLLNTSDTLSEMFTSHEMQVRVKSQVFELESESSLKSLS